MNARCQIVVAVDIAKMGNAFVCKVSLGNSVNKVINTYEEPNLERNMYKVFKFDLNIKIDIAYFSGLP